MKHRIITIGCEYGAKGNAIGKKVAEDLHIKFYDRELIVSRDVIEKVEEGIIIAGKGAKGQERGNFSKYADLTERALHVQEKIIRKLAERESCVIIGRSSDYILKDRQDLLRIFIYSPDEVRVKNIMESHNLPEADARMLLQEKDKRYHKRHLAMTGSNRGDRHNRDLLLDSSLLGIEGSAQMIEQVANKVFAE